MGSIAEKPAVEASEDLPTVEERGALIARVAASEQFKRSTRLREFLLYVGTESLKDDCSEIHEQDIGAKVFARPDSYDRTADTIVRVNASELRKRIKSYFDTAGVRETLIFEIPPGSYKPVFRRRLPEPSSRSLAAEEPSDSALTVEPLGMRVRARWYAHPMWALLSVFLAVACVVLGLACAVLNNQNRTLKSTSQLSKGQPAVAAFWTGFLDPARQTAIVMSDDSASVIEDITHRPVTLNDYVTRDFLSQIQSSSMSDDRKADLQEIFNHNLTNFGAARAAQLIVGEIPPEYPRYLVLARNFTAGEITRNNVVLIGSKKAVPWDHLFDGQLNFATDYDDAHSHMYIRNSNPRPGEQAVYETRGAGDNFAGYAAIAYLPNPDRTGRVILLTGTDMDTTAAAAWFLTSEDRLEKLQKTWHVNRFPYFEAVLKVSFMRGTFFDAECVAYRTYPDLR